jgi:hypothetical protein
MRAHALQSEKRTGRIDANEISILIAQRKILKGIVNKTFTLTVFLAAFQVGTFAGLGQEFVIDWFTIDGGGGTSTGGVYSVSGTIGQPDAGILTGGPYTLVGGFWAVVSAIQTPGAPVLTVKRETVGGMVTISWPRPAEEFVLDVTSDLTTIPAFWTQVPFPYQTNATDIFITVPAPVINKFYRLRKPVSGP